MVSQKDSNWIVKKGDGSIYGPVDADTILRWIHERRVAPEDFISPEDKEEWIPARSVSPFAELFGPQPGETIDLDGLPGETESEPVPKNIYSRFKDKYELISKIGRGGMGVVYRARQENPSRDIVIKLMAGGRFASETHRRRFEREAEAVSKLNHPFIVSVYEVGEAEGDAYFTMEYVEGRRLDEYAEREILGIEAILELMQKICEGIAYAHQRGVIHRDLKPSNILIDSEGRPRILDFGLARIMGVETTQTSMTGVVMGTPAYMSPEQISGRPEEIDIRTDVYSLGSILYQLLTKHTPHDVENAHPLLAFQKIMEEEPTLPSSLNKHIDKELCAIVLKALEKEKQKRYQNAGALAEDIENYLSGNLVNAHPVNTIHRLGKLLWRKRKITIPVGVVLVAFVIAIALFMLQLMASRERALEAQKEVEGKKEKIVSLLGKLQNVEEKIERLIREDKWLEAYQIALFSEQSMPHEADARGLTDLVKQKVATRILQKKRALLNLSESENAPDIEENFYTIANIRKNMDEFAARDKWIEAYRITKFVERVMSHNPEAKGLTEELRQKASNCLSRFENLLADQKYEEARTQLRSVEAISRKLDFEDLRNQAEKRVDNFRNRETIQEKVESLISGDKWVEAYNTVQLGKELLPEEGDIKKLGQKLRMQAASQVEGIRAKLIEQIRDLNFQGAKTELERLEEFGSRLPFQDLKDQIAKLRDNFGEECYKACYLTVKQKTTFTEKISAVDEFLSYAQKEPLLEEEKGRSLLVKVVDQSIGDLRKYISHNNWIKICSLIEKVESNQSLLTFHEGQVLLNKVRTCKNAVPPLHNFENVCTCKGHSGAVYSVAPSPDTKYVGSGSQDHTIRLWDIDKGSQVKILEGHSGDVNAIVFSPNGRLLASGSSDKTIRIWKVTTGKKLRTLRGHSDKVLALAFSPDGTLLASGSKDATIKLWDVNNGKELRILKGHMAGVLSVAFCPDGEILASGSADHGIKLWKVSTGEEIGTLKNHAGGVNSVVFSHDGQGLASGSEDKTIRLWEIKSRKEVKTLAGHSRAVNAVVFLPDGRMVASGSDDKTVRIWDVVTGKQIGKITGESETYPGIWLQDKGHTYAVEDIAFSPKGRFVISASKDMTVRVWHCRTARKREDNERE